jgi:hypothetical protein
METAVPRTSNDNARVEFFTAMKIRVVVFWVVTPLIDVLGYQRCGG